MVSEVEKMTVAENCSGYNPRNAGMMSSMGSLSESCSNCASFVRGKCIKNLFDDISNTLRIN